jgi:hypothetical protein
MGLKQPVRSPKFSVSYCYGPNMTWVEGWDAPAPAAATLTHLKPSTPASPVPSHFLGIFLLLFFFKMAKKPLQKSGWQAVLRKGLVRCPLEFRAYKHLSNAWHCSKSSAKKCLSQPLTTPQRADNRKSTSRLRSQEKIVKRGEVWTANVSHPNEVRLGRALLWTDTCHTPSTDAVRSVALPNRAPDQASTACDCP